MKKPAPVKKAPSAPSRPIPRLATCASCRFWRERTCRRYPPTPLAGAGNVQPQTSEQDSCGEHRP